MSMETQLHDTASSQEPIVEVKNLQTAFFTDKETILAVDGVSFAIRPGQTVGIVGESGSGKSVTARSIMRLIESPGRILEGSSIRFTRTGTVQTFATKFDGRVVDVTTLENEYSPAQLLEDPSVDATPQEFDCDHVSEVSLADVLASGYADDLGIIDEDDCVFVTGGTPQNPTDGFVEITRVSGEAKRLMRGGRIGMIFQDPLTSLNPVYTVGNQIKESLRLHQGLRGREATEEAANLLEAVGIPDARRRVEEYPHEFSGGMRQRAVIAMALACEPEVLICDEPTTALDVTIQAQILELLADIQEERDLAIMFITHDMGVIANVTDKVNVMYAGEIIETAGVERLFENPKHPYTRGLLESIPGSQTGEKLRTIDGNVPTPTEPATDCRFAPRCPKEFDECTQIHPELVPVDGEDEDHVTACLLYPEDRSTPQAVEYHQRQARGGEDR
ncbi:dipeptide/oligopeptide/nickel ABC transporter ATP-binding protein [Halobacteriales archaeon QH_7_66_37]|nr:MAG: dipeptide/oligopeptide/nickel ABC transporter ATP-binding protein [Halobacteriales archaeon QH_7_66_37]